MAPEVSLLRHYDADETQGTILLEKNQNQTTVQALRDTSLNNQMKNIGDVKSEIDAQELQINRKGLVYPDLVQLCTQINALLETVDLRRAQFFKQSNESHLKYSEKKRGIQLLIDSMQMQTANLASDTTLKSFEDLKTSLVKDLDESHEAQLHFRAKQELELFDKLLAKKLEFASLVHVIRQWRTDIETKSQVAMTSQLNFTAPADVRSKQSKHE